MNMAEQNPTDRVWSAIEDIRFCMLTSRDGEQLRARPMAAFPDRQAECVWFFTDERAHKDDEIARNPQVCMAFADTKNNTYVSVSGRAELRRDEAKKKELWSVHLQAWFPGGPDDPKVVLLRVEPGEAELWDGTSSSLIYMLETARAAITGTRPNAGDNVKVTL
jgi:general stress protein 26